jgi:hypothetical protein
VLLCWALVALNKQSTHRSVEKSNAFPFIMETGGVWRHDLLCHVTVTVTVTCHRGFSHRFSLSLTVLPRRTSQGELRVRGRLFFAFKISPSCTSLSNDGRDDCQGPREGSVLTRASPEAFRRARRNVFVVASVFSRGGKSLEPALAPPGPTICSVPPSGFGTKA